MSDWNLSVVIIVPAALKDKANYLSCAIGHDDMPGNTFSVPLSADGSEPATHYGCRTTAKQEFIDIMTGAETGQLPDVDWQDYNMNVQDIADILSQQILDVRDAGEMSGHFGEVLELNSLKRVKIDG